MSTQRPGQANAEAPGIALKSSSYSVIFIRVGSLVPYLPLLFLSPPPSLIMGILPHKKKRQSILQ